MDEYEEEENTQTKKRSCYERLKSTEISSSVISNWHCYKVIFLNKSDRYLFKGRTFQRLNYKDWIIDINYFRTQVCAPKVMEKTIFFLFSQKLIKQWMTLYGYRDF